jgi:hypothetical protein
LGNHLHVCVVSYRFAPAIGGAEKRAEKLARQLVGLGHEVSVVTLHFEQSLPRLEWMDGIRVIRVPGIYRRNGKLRLGKVGRIFSDFLFLGTLWRLSRWADNPYASNYQLTKLWTFARTAGAFATRGFVAC